MCKRFDIGFLGGGQLARMSIQAAQRMGYKCVSIDPSEDSPASQIAPAVGGRLDDVEALARIFAESERVTLENEFIRAGDIRAAMSLAGFDSSNLMPGVDALESIQDKLLQRQALERAGVPSPKAVIAVQGEQEIGLPMVLKVRFGGYDGKGTRYAKDRDQLLSHGPLASHPEWLAEAFVPFRRELAVMVVRTRDASIAFPTMETIQTNHVCDLVFPCDANAGELAIAAVEAVGGYGLFGIELFQLESGEILVNEIAPRPHNSGHYTLDWESTSQFEAHVRAVMSLPLEKLEPCSSVVMANLLGQEGSRDYRSAIPAALSHQGARFHWYGKLEAKPGRKMGHLNLVAARNEQTDAIVSRAVQARSDFYKAWTRI